MESIREQFQREVIHIAGHAANLFVEQFYKQELNELDSQRYWAEFITASGDGFDVAVKSRTKRGVDRCKNAIDTLNEALTLCDDIDEHESKLADMRQTINMGVLPQRTIDDAKRDESRLSLLMKYARMMV